MISPIHNWVAEKTGLLNNLNPETLHNWQIEKLKNLIKYASENTSFYKDKLHITNDISELPFTLPSEIANDPFAFLAIPQNLVSRVTTLANSGTTRLKKRIFFSESDLERTIDFFAIGMSSMVNKGEHAQILISNRTENSLGSLLKESLSRIGVHSEISGAIKSVNSAIEDARKAGCLVGMPAEILYMSCVDETMRPKSVLLTADFIPQSIIERIKNTWKCNVFSHYGHTEFGYGFAVDCNHHNGFHLRSADFIVEIINLQTGKPANIGESGEIVITTLSNEAMPLIRYRTGNISSIIDSPCPCGCNLPQLGKLEGRIESTIPIGNDGTISIHLLDEIIFANSFVRGFNAALYLEANKNTLLLTIDSTDTIDFSAIKDKLPQELNIKIKYDSVDPFFTRRKRRIQII
ncbi:MAG: DVU_1553 family AMP-dependent CoA ligase [Bacteroidota bacterium]